MNHETQLTGNHSVFIDKTAFLAFMNPENSRHAKARSVFLELDDLERPLVTTHFVIAETHEWLRDHVGYDHAQFFLNTIDKTSYKGVLSFLTVNENWEKDAKELLLEYPNYEFSMGEAITAMIILKYQIDRIFTFNSRFRQLPKLYSGIKVIPSSTI